jgi:hypothetical protein
MSSEAGADSFTFGNFSYLGRLHRYNACPYDWTLFACVSLLDRKPFWYP